jgi:hypothetical protein
MFVLRGLRPPPMFPGIYASFRTQPSLLDPMDEGQVNVL